MQGDYFLICSHAPGNVFLEFSPHFLNSWHTSNVKILKKSYYFIELGVSFNYFIKQWQKVMEANISLHIHLWPILFHFSSWSSSKLSLSHMWWFLSYSFHSFLFSLLSCGVQHSIYIMIGQFSCPSFAHFGGLFMYASLIYVKWCLFRLPFNGIFWFFMIAFSLTSGGRFVFIICHLYWLSFIWWAFISIQSCFSHVAFLIMTITMYALFYATFWIHFWAYGRISYMV